MDTFLTNGYILQMPIDSSIVEVGCALIFDVLLIGSIELLCQAICSNYNLHHIYDTPYPLPLPSRCFALFGDGLIGIPWISSLFTAVLGLCVASNIAIGFSVTGCSARVFRTTNFATLVTVLDPPILLDIDIANEFAILAKDNKVVHRNRKPDFLSTRLVALQKNDWCQMCNYTHCNVLSYAYRSDVFDTNLMHTADAFNRFQASCVSTRSFSDDFLMVTSARFNPNTASCKFKSLTVLTNSITSASNGIEKAVGHSGKLIDSDTHITYTFQYCHYNVSHMSCYVRTGHATRCAAIAKRVIPKHNDASSKYPRIRHSNQRHSHSKQRYGYLSDIYISVLQSLKRLRPAPVHQDDSIFVSNRSGPVIYPRAHPVRQLCLQCATARTHRWR